MHRIHVSKRNLFNLALVLLVWTAFGIFFGTQSYIRDAYFGKGASLPGRIVSWIICGYSWGILTYPVIVFVRRFSLEKLSWTRFLLVHVPAAFLFSVLQLGIYLSISTVLFGVSSRGLWEYYKLLLASELQSSVLVYLVIVSVITAYSKFFKPGSVERAIDTRKEVPFDNPPVPTTNGANGFLHRIPVKENGKIVLVDTGDIDWIESFGNYLFLHTAERKYIYRETMAAMEKKLDPAEFVRIRRSTVVKVSRIKELHPTDNGEFEIVLSDGTALASTRRYRKNLEPVLKS